MIRRNKIIALSIAMAIAMASGVIEAGASKLTVNNEVATENSEKGIEAYDLAVSEEEYSKPKQVNVHMGDDPSTQVNITYTTINFGLETKIVLKKVGDNKEITVLGENSIGNANKYFHKIAVNNLEPNTQYEYIVGTGEDTFSGKFKTAPAVGSKDSIKFAYIADTQVSNATNAKALGATLEEVNNIEDLDFIYLAGDITDTSANETQWELLFNNDGAFPTGGQDMFGNNLVTVVQGNHDNNSLTRHINAPAESGNIVYSYDYGPVTFIMLNLETARYDADARLAQKEHLTEVVSKAKSRGQWIFVGFHKSIYTGASHITDSDVIEARKYWSPVLTDLDVDVVMQGHDHVYSRGFVDENGYKAEITTNDDGTVVDPENVPLYMVGGHAGGLKWYSKKNYTVGDGDLLAPGYSFLDVNSTDTGSDVKKEQVIVEMEVSEKKFTLNTYMFKYDTDTDTITTNKYLYDTLTVVRDLNESPYTASMPNIDNIEGKAGVEFRIPVTVNELPTDSIIRASEMTFDIPEDLEVKTVELNNKIIKANNWDYNVDEGKLRIALANLDDEPIFVNNTSGDKNIVTLTVGLKEDKSKEESTSIKMSGLVLRCENDLDIEYDTKNAKSNITFVDKEVAQVSARELYVSDGIDVIPENMKAVAAEFTLVENTTNINFGDSKFYYSPEFTEKTGKITYVALVPEETSLYNLSDMKNYTLIESNKQSESVAFGDINNDGIDAQDALVAVSSWLRKRNLDNKEMITVNVNADGRINTRDAIDIVDNYVSAREFTVLSK
ncbi:metallophosphoesterase [Clostridium tertium]